MKRIPLLIFGAGNVGRALVQQLVESALVHARRDSVSLPIVAWCDSHGAVIDEDGLDETTLAAIAAAKAGGTPLSATASGYRQDDPCAIVDVAGTDGCIVVDVTATDSTVPAIELALKRGYSAVTANKLPLTGSLATFEALVSSGCFRYESTVGSAVPVIEAMHGLMRANDRIDAIRGALSGTLGFLCTGLEAGRPFSALVQEAMRRGYTEPDPRVDLGGQDVARKALILARTMGWRLDLTGVAVSSLVPADLAGLPLAEFLERLPALDAAFAAQVAAARAENKVLRYIAELRDFKAAVGMQAVPSDTALGRLRGNDNLVAFQTRYYPDEPLVVQGRGAGVDAAAAGVHSDIIAIAACGK